mmetsp:Transcript_2662/g.5175  ORF Transcript_2662/g.5175 Transcript_2662/m.5175 type:complete len:204 (-) Transcript_2662:47-658(-)
MELTRSGDDFGLQPQYRLVLAPSLLVSAGPLFSSLPPSKRGSVRAPAEEFGVVVDVVVAVVCGSSSSSWWWRRLGLPQYTPQLNSNDVTATRVRARRNKSPNILLLSLSSLLCAGYSKDRRTHRATCATSSSPSPPSLEWHCKMTTIKEHTVSTTNSRPKIEPNKCQTRLRACSSDMASAFTIPAKVGRNTFKPRRLREGMMS